MKFSLLFTVFVFAVFSFVVMVHVKTDVARLHDERGGLLKQQNALRETMKVQQAELAHLTSPERLERLALMAGMVPMETGQMRQAAYFIGEGF